MLRIINLSKCVSQDKLTFYEFYMNNIKKSFLRFHSHRCASAARNSLSFSFEFALNLSLKLALCLFAFNAHAINFIDLQKEVIKDFTEDYRTNPNALWENQDILPYASRDDLDKMISDIELDHHSYMQVVTIDAETSKLNGEDFSELSLVAVKGGKLKAIPFQLDEFDDKGLIYIKDIAERYGNEHHGEKGVFDGDDQFLFMFRDAGTRRIEPDGERIKSFAAIGIVHEFVIERKGVPTRYAYLMKNVKKPSTVDYVKFDIKKGHVETPVAKINFDPKNLTRFTWVESKAGSNYGNDIMDMFGVEISTGIFNESLRVSLNSRDNISLKPIDFKNGTIRDVIVGELTIKYLKIPLFKVPMQLLMYEQRVGIYLGLELDGLKWAHYLLSALKKPRGNFFIDFNLPDGAKYTFERQYEKEQLVCLVNDEMDAIENNVTNYRLPGDWVWLDSNVGWNFFMEGIIGHGGVIDKVLTDMNLGLTYADHEIQDDNFSFERYVGAGPRLGFETQGIPTFFEESLRVIGALDLDKMEYMSELLPQAIKLSKKGKLDKLNTLFKETFKALEAEGKVKNMNDIAEMSLEEFARLNFRGMNYEIFRNMYLYSIAGFETIDDFDLAESMRRAQEYIDTNDIDLEYFRYLGVSIFLEFPAALDNDDPDLFYKRLQNPYTLTVNEL